MEAFPIIKNTQVVVSKADARTGQVLTVDNEVYINNGKPTYLVFENIDLAHRYINGMRQFGTAIEFCIYGKEEKFIEFIPALWWTAEKISIPIRAVPAICLPLRRRYLYTLSDFAYGEWLIFEDNMPKYYLNIFDECYKNITRFLQTQRDITVDLMVSKSLGNVNERLSLGQKYHVITMLESQSELLTFELEKVSPDLLTSGVINEFRKFINNSLIQES
jgi:hypothetical protein